MASTPQCANKQKKYRIMLKYHLNIASKSANAMDTQSYDKE